MIAYVISMSRYYVAADNVLRCGQTVIYPCISSCRITEICVLFVLGSVKSATHKSLSFIKS